MREVWVLYNRLAGPPANARRVEAAAEAVARRGVTVRLVSKAEMTGLRLAAREAVAAGVDAVLVAGGDGTVGAIAGELAGSPVALGALPAGTANVWARSLGLPAVSPWRPQALTEGALLLVDSPARPTDMGECNGDRFLVWLGLGVDAFVTRHFEAQRQLSRQVGGFLYNTLLTVVMARHARGVSLQVRANGREIAGTFVLVDVMNIGYHIGGLVRLARDVRLDDGRMDVWLFEGQGYWDAVGHTARAALGRHTGHPGVTRLTTDQVEIVAVMPEAYHMDAEPRPPAARLNVRVLAHALRVLVPPRAAEHYAG